jgi:hypothetical protein
MAGTMAMVLVLVMVMVMAAGVPVVVRLPAAFPGTLLARGAMIVPPTGGCSALHARCRRDASGARVGVISVVRHAGTLGRRFRRCNEAKIPILSCG